MSEYIKKEDILSAAVEVEYLGRPRQMVSLAKIEKIPEVEAVYACNRKKCENCNPDCDFTKDIEYAAATDKVFIIDNTPSINIDRPQGEWEEKTTFHNADDNPIIEEWQSARCSVCHKYHTTPYIYYFDNYNFCPNCGADMRGEVRDE